MVERNAKLTKEEARALIADLSEDEKRLLSGLLAEMKKDRQADRKAAVDN